MSDNLTLPGTGSVAAAKDIGSGVLAQRVVAVNGTADVSTGNPLPVVLPAGFATSAKQAALGTIGSPSADVLTTQGNYGGTPMPVGGLVKNLSCGITLPGSIANSGAGYSANQIAADTTLAPLFLSNFARINNGTLTIVSATHVLLDYASAAPSMDFAIFDGSVAVNMPADGSTVTLSDSQISSIIAIIPMLAADARLVGGHTVYSYTGIPIPLLVNNASSKNLYGLYILRSSWLPTAAGKQLRTKLGVYQD